MIRFAIYLFILLISSEVSGQVLHQRVSQSQISIGQPVTINYIVDAKPSDTILFTEKSETIKARSITESGDLSKDGIDFEIVSDFRDTNLFINGQKKWVGEYVITAWDSGLYVLPGPQIIINDSTFYFENIAIATHLSTPIDSVDLYDIRENFTELPIQPFSIIDFFTSYWWVILIILILALAIARFIKNRNESDREDEIKPPSLKDRTILAINSLDSSKLWEKDELKRHFVELSYILRSYLTSRYSISLLDKTSYQTKILLTEKGLNKETVDVVARILSQSDMVKFAKSKPELIEILRISTLAKQIVVETSPLEFDNVE
ncbi:MAG: hypothetical protein KC454_06115 [Flavobacteriales bacterium]|nr:hypothetical protein [Flavobacteriales bacterium]